MNDNGASIGGMLGELIGSGIQQWRRARERRQIRDALAAAREIERREAERRAQWIELVMRQMARGSAGDATMAEARAARRNPLDDRRY